MTKWTAKHCIDVHCINFVSVICDTFQNYDLKIKNKTL